MNGSSVLFSRNIIKKKKKHSNITAFVKYEAIIIICIHKGKVSTSAKVTTNEREPGLFTGNRKRLLEIFLVGVVTNVSMKTHDRKK